ncbi:putative pentatricopeptide repeat-containing protein At3g01580 isoform X2 [Phragmites australis]|uniref:putative pentatricopeptide repeat-containing protein At3g01580 isoform X2 n=1 Tax=Phragmites australis TaxID=29695 RepID=UPI002D782335|nr:putative pentatricopeptide repeat-containing protein At3g01580 isoform X2 [Phragmites australis]
MRPLQKLLEAAAAASTALAAAHLHAYLLRSGCLHSSHRLTARVLASYPPGLARDLFDEIPDPTPRLANALLRAHLRARQWRTAILLVPRLRARPDCFTLPLLLRACAMLPSLAHGRTVHAVAVRSCAASDDAFVAVAIVQMYARCGDMFGSVNAYSTFEKPDVVLRTSVVTGYEQNGLPDEALEFFARNVIDQGVVPSPVTLVSVMSAAAQLGDVRNGKACHAFALRSGLEYKPALANAVLWFYMKIGAVQAARRLFEGMTGRDVVTWSCMVKGYVQSGDAPKALGVYKEMVEVGVQPNSVTLVSVLQACALALDVEKGKKIHHIAVNIDCELEVGVATALVDMYMKCSCHEEAMRLFHRMPKKDVVAWAAVISGLKQNGLPDESLQVFKCMLLDGHAPDAVMMVKVLAACSESGVICQAICLHGYLVRSGFCNKVFVAAALVDLYSKCGSLGNAIRIFESATEKDVVLWSSMIAGYGVHGLACSHSGLVQEGKQIFDSMTQVYGVMPNQEHQSSMVDLLGRAGELQEATRVIQEMDGRAVAHTWCALLAACRAHSNTEMSEVVANNLLRLDPDHVGYYNLLTNIYAFDQKWDSVKKTRDMVRGRGLNKVPGYSAVEVNNVVHKFFAGQRSHRDWEKICTLLWELSQKLRGEDCCFPVDTDLALEDFSLL